MPSESGPALTSLVLYQGTDKSVTEIHPTSNFGAEVVGHARAADTIDSLSLFPSESKAAEQPEVSSPSPRDNMTRRQAAVATQAVAKTPKSEAPAQADLRGQLRDAELALRLAAAEVGALKTQLDQLRGIVTDLTKEYARVEHSRVLQKRHPQVPVPASLPQTTRRTRVVPTVGVLGALALVGVILTAAGNIDRNDIPIVLPPAPVFIAADPPLPDFTLNSVVPTAPPTQRPETTTRPPTAATKATAVKGQPSSTPVPLAELTGGLDVDSDPSGAAVFVDRKHIGETPIQLHGLRAGSHVIWVELEGYQRWTAGVLVPADKLTPVRATLQRGRGR